MKLISYWNHFLRGWKDHFISQTTTLFVVSGCFSVLLGFFIVSKNLNLFLSEWGQASQMSFFLEDDISEKRKSDIIRELKSFAFIKDVRVFSKKDTAELFMNDIHDLVGDVLTKSDLVESMPSTIEAGFVKSLKPQEKLKKLETLREKFINFSGIGEISFGQSWLSSYKKIIYSISSSTVFFAVILLLGSILIISNSIKSSVYQRQDEIRVMELVGATKNMIRAPFIFEGLLLGAVAATLSLTLCWFVFKWEVQILQEHFGLFGFGKGLVYLSFGQILLTVLCGGGLGALGSLVSVKKFTRIWRDN